VKEPVRQEAARDARQKRSPSYAPRGWKPRPSQPTVQKTSHSRHERHVRKRQFRRSTPATAGDSPPPRPAGTRRKGASLEWGRGTKVAP
jgi:hypothetical protein